MEMEEEIGEEEEKRRILVCQGFLQVDFSRLASSKELAHRSLDF